MFFSVRYEIAFIIFTDTQYNTGIGKEIDWTVEYKVLYWNFEHCPSCLKTEPLQKNSLGHDKKTSTGIRRHLSVSGFKPTS